MIPGLIVLVSYSLQAGKIKAVFRAQARFGPYLGA